MVPTGAPFESWVSHAGDVPALRENYPIVHSLTHANAREMLQDWGYAVATGAGQLRPNVVTDQVWTIQLTARPGYYVAPEVQVALGWMDETTDAGAIWG